MHLVLLGHLVYRSGYIPRLLGVGLVVAGLGYAFSYVQPYLYPDTDLSVAVVSFTGLGALAFLLWLLIRGWKIPEPTLDRTASRRPS